MTFLALANYVVYPKRLIGSRCFFFADWSNSTYRFGWLVRIKAMILLICLISKFWSAALAKPLDGADYRSFWARQIGSIKSVIRWISCLKWNRSQPSRRHSSFLALFNRAGYAEPQWQKKVVLSGHLSSALFWGKKRNTCKVTRVELVSLDKTGIRTSRHVDVWLKGIVRSKLKFQLFWEFFCISNVLFIYLFKINK